MKIAISIKECTSYTLKFPKNTKELEAYVQDPFTSLTGKVIVLDSNLPFYVTVDFLELEFASRQPFLVIIPDETSMKEKRWVRDPERLPLIDTNLTDKEIDLYQFIDFHENDVKENLIKHKYIEDDSNLHELKHPLDNFSKSDLNKYLKEKYEK